MEYINDKAIGESLVTVKKLNMFEFSHRGRVTRNSAYGSGCGEGFRATKASGSGSL